MVGPDLNHVQHECQIVYKSQEDPDPSHYSDRDWLGSFFTEDGKNVIALVHNEYHGWQHSGMCNRPAGMHAVLGVLTPLRGHCWWNSIDFMKSSDGGVTFTMPKAPGNFVVGVTVPYDPNNTGGASGYGWPSNIVKYQAYYYFMTGAWRAGTQQLGSCLLRTKDPFEPNSWRAWDGSGFNAAFFDPYRAGSAAAHAVTCQPVTSDIIDSVVYDPAQNMFITTTSHQSSNPSTSGFYIAASTDLIHWSKPSLVLSFDTMASYDGPGTWGYGYSSIIDAAAADRDFVTTSNSPYLYYVRWEKSRPALGRRLYRVKIKIKF
jgi:hypothetical protein